MLKRRLGDEDALFAELTKQYSAEEEPTVAALVRLDSAFYAIDNNTTAFKPPNFSFRPTGTTRYTSFEYSS